MLRRAQGHEGYETQPVHELSPHMKTSAARLFSAKGNWQPLVMPNGAFQKTSQFARKEVER